MNCLKSKHCVVFLAGFFVLSLFFVSSGLLLGAEDKTISGGENPRQDTVVVIGVRNATVEEKWKHLAIGYGISDFVADELAQSGMFRFLEQDAAVVEKIRGIQEKVWLLNEDFDKADLARYSEETKSAIVAFGKVTHIAEKRVKGFCGPMNIGKKIGEVKVEVSLFIKQTGEVISAEGKGKSSKGIWGMVLAGDVKKLKFDNYMVGKASKIAVEKAVKNLLIKYQKYIKKGERR